MSLFSRIVQSLDTPDDQGNDWYGWACNQMAHALLGVIVALFFPVAALQVAAIIALLKECTDIIKVPTARTFRDSAADIAFWLIGAWMASPGIDVAVPVWILFAALICGIIPRARKALIGA